MTLTQHRGHSNLQRDPVWLSVPENASHDRRENKEQCEDGDRKGETN